MLDQSVGLTNEEMASLTEPETCASFDDTDRLVLRYADVLTRENRADDTLYAALEKRFPQIELLELSFTVGLSNLLNRGHATFRTDLDDSTRAKVGDAPMCPIGR
jgi:alkylhydroperoxidase family enzyme